MKKRNKMILGFGLVLFGCRTIALYGDVVSGVIFNLLGFSVLLSYGRD